MNPEDISNEVFPAPVSLSDILIRRAFAETGPGRTFIDSAGYRPGGGGSYPHAVVLAGLPDNTLHPFVTWVLVMPDDGRDPYTISGDYCTDLAAGVKSLAERAERI